MKRANSFFIFCDDNRKEISIDNPSWSNAQVTSKLGELWRNLDKITKSKYTTLARERRNKYKKENIDVKKPLLAEKQYQMTFKLKKIKGSKHKIFSEPISYQYTHNNKHNRRFVTNSQQNVQNREIPTINTIHVQNNQSSSSSICNSITNDYYNYYFNYIPLPVTRITTQFAPIYSPSGVNSVLKYL